MTLVIGGYLLAIVYTWNHLVPRLRGHNLCSIFLLSLERKTLYILYIYIFGSKENILYWFPTECPFESVVKMTPGKKLQDEQSDEDVLSGLGFGVGAFLYRKFEPDLAEVFLSIQSLRC